MTHSSITGTTYFYAMLGHPVAQVRTPTVLNAYLQKNDIAAAMTTFDILPKNVDRFFEMLRAWENCGGCAVTIPHKQAALNNVDDATDRARRIGAVNLIKRETNGRLVGDMTDGVGFLKALAGHGWSVGNKNVVLIGAGGAGSAIAHAVADNQANRLAIIDIDQGRRDTLIKSLKKNYSNVETTHEVGSIKDIDILANATPMGMKNGDPLPFSLEDINSDTLVADAVTKPPLTRFLKAAKNKGCTIQQGNEMSEAQLPIFLEWLKVK